jgi:hypothetical protein
MPGTQWFCFALFRRHGARFSSKRPPTVPLGFFPQLGWNFPQRGGTIHQKSPFSPEEPHGDFFRVYDGFGDFFYAYNGFFYGRKGHFREVRAHSILQLRWKSHPWDFHRNCRKTSLSIVIAEKVRREGQQVGIFSYRDRGQGYIPTAMR